MSDESIREMRRFPRMKKEPILSDELCIVAEKEGCSFSAKICRPCSIAAAGLVPKNVPPAHFPNGPTLSGFESLHA